MKYSILTILDITRKARSVESIAMKLAIEWPATLMGVGVIDTKHALSSEATPVGGMSFKVEEDLRKANEARKKAKRNLQVFSQDCITNGLSCDVAQAEGDYIQIIRTLSQEHDLILMDQNTSFLFEPNLGSINDLREIIRNTSRPVYICASHYIPGKEIIVPYDGSQPCARALHQFLLLGLHVNLPIKIVTIGTDIEKVNEIAGRARSLCLRFGRVAQIEVIQTADKPAKVIMNYVEEHQPELVVMGAFGHTGFKEMLFGSVTEKLLSGSKSSLFVVG
jgi:nucleotide-binding universal stress UspA family protein